MDALPKKVRVGYASYTIENWSTELATAASMYGECDNLNHIIRVRADLNPQEAANTLLHEIMHAAWKVGGCDEGDQEKVVTILSNILTQVWQDNPDVMEWIGKHAKL